jgi:hypothetical protein
MIKLENIQKLQNFIEPDTYVIYPTGGYHYFSLVKNAPQKYKKPIWPYVQKLKRLNNRGHFKKGIITAGINQNKSWYPMLNLERYVMRKSSKRRETKKQSMHQLVALAFIPNLDPLNNTVVHHKNNDKSDYRIENLEWSTMKENSIGTPMHLRKTPDQVWKLYSQTLFYETQS